MANCSNCNSVCTTNACTGQCVSTCSDLCSNSCTDTCINSNKADPQGVAHRLDKIQVNLKIKEE